MMSTRRAKLLFTLKEFLMKEIVECAGKLYLKSMIVAVFSWMLIFLIVFGVCYAIGYDVVSQLNLTESLVCK
jgi:hypothetical protein